MTPTNVFLFFSIFLHGVNMIEAFLVASPIVPSTSSKPLTQINSSPSPPPNFYNPQESGLRAPNQNQLLHNPEIGSFNGPPQQVANPYQQQNLPYVSYPNPNPFLSSGQGMGQVGQPDLQNAQNPGKPIPVNVQPNGLAVPPGGMNRFQKALEEYNKKHGIEKQDSNDVQSSASANDRNKELIIDDGENEYESLYREQEGPFGSNSHQNNIITSVGQQYTSERSAGQAGYQQQLQLTQQKRRQNQDQSSSETSSFSLNSSPQMKSSFMPQSPPRLEKTPTANSVPFQERNKIQNEDTDSSVMSPQEKIKALLRSRVAGNPEKEKLIEKLIISETTGVTSTKEDITATYEKTLKTGGTHGFAELKGKAPPGMGQRQDSTFPPQQQANMPNMPNAQNMQNSMPMMGQSMMPQMPPSPYPPYGTYGMGYPGMNLPYGGQGIDPMYYQQMMMQQQQQQQYQQQMMMMQQQQQQPVQILNQVQGDLHGQIGQALSPQIPSGKGDEISADFSSEITGRKPPQGEPQYPLILSGGEASLVEDSLPIIQDLIFDDGYVDEEKYKETIHTATKYVNGLQNMLQNLQISLNMDSDDNDATSEFSPISTSPMSDFPEETSPSTSSIMSALNEDNLDYVNNVFVPSKESIEYREVPDVELSEDDKAILNGASSMVLKHSGTFGNEPLLVDEELKLMQGSLPKAEAILRKETEDTYGTITEDDYNGFDTTNSLQAQQPLTPTSPKKKLSYKEMLEQAKMKKVPK